MPERSEPRTDPARGGDGERPPLIERVRALAPLVEGEAEEAERNGTLSDKVVDALAEAGVFRMLLPRAAGGEGASTTEAIPVIEELARQDASVGWCSGTGTLNSGVVYARVGESALPEIFRDARSVCAGVLSPFGRARRVEGGWRVEGRFKFGSGVRFATTVTAGCVVVDGDGEPLANGGRAKIVAVCARPEDVEMHLDWSVSGLEATGSGDFSLHDLFVPEDRAFDLDDVPRRGGRLLSLPLMSSAYFWHMGFALGVGLRALEEVRTLAASKVRLGSRLTLVERPTFQRDLAVHETALRAARLLCLDTFAGVEQTHRPGDPLPLEARADIAQAAIHTAEVATAAAEFAFRAAGAHAVQRDTRIQRCLRDMLTGRQSAAMCDEVWERVGQVRLGRASDDIML